MKTLKNVLLCSLLLFICIFQAYAQEPGIPDYKQLGVPKFPELTKSLSLFVKLKDATIIRDLNGSGNTYYTWNSGLYNNSRFTRRPILNSNLLTNDQWVMKLDSATWNLEVKMNVTADDDSNIAINYFSFEVPEVKTESVKYGFMNEGAYEAGGYFTRGGYVFQITFYEYPQEFKYIRIPPH